MSMEPKVIAYGRVTFNEGAVVPARLYNCTVADSGLGNGDFTVTIGQACDRLLCQIVVIPDSASDTGMAPSTVHTSDTAKRIQFRDAAGAIAAPSRSAWFEIHRLPPLPTP